MKAEDHALVRELPICAVLDDIRRTLENDDTLIVEAPPGAGKTTVIPLALLREAWLAGRRIIMLQPRRIAARNAAARMAALLGEKPGATVGYRMRHDTRVSAQTQIEVVTEGVLLRMLSEDPSLADVGLLIFDEFHERSLDGDLGLALALHGRATFEPEQPLKLLVMSATLDQAELSEFLACPVVRSDGRMYPVAVEYRPLRGSRPRIVDETVAAIGDAVSRHPDSNILAFLPGQGEINQVERALALPASVAVHPLLGSLSMDAQQRAIAAPGPGQRKVVLATNVAETSLTIDGVHVVIDSGLERRPIFDPNTGMSRLNTVKISQASSEQRRGRAGRLGPGHCYRLWSESQHAQMPGHLAPEIDEADLTSLVLQLFDWGIYDPAELRWLTPPPQGAYDQARDLLSRLGAIENTEAGPRLTRHGAAMARLPTHPRLAHMLIAGAAVGAASHAALFAAVLSDRDPLGRETPDMSLRMDYLENRNSCPPAYRGWCERTRRLAKQLQEQLQTPKVVTLERLPEDQLPGYLLACAYPERIARRRHKGGYQLANGRSAQFADDHALGKHRWLSVAEVGGLAGRRGDVIRSAAALDPDLFGSLLHDLIAEEVQIDWDAKSGRFMAERQRRCGALVLERKTLDSVPDALRTQKLLDLIRDEGLAKLDWNAEARGFLTRAQTLEALEKDWPAFSEDALLASLDEWLAPYLATVKRLADLKKINLVDALKSRLTWKQQQHLDQQLPQRFEVSTGSRIAIDYGQSPPVLAVKLQEMFGCTETPAVAAGRLPLTVHLLSPAGRPLQVTQDLQGFWDSSYAEVRKEMRGRYPKHPWPEDPRNAPPTRYTKHRR